MYVKKVIYILLTVLLVFFLSLIFSPLFLVVGYLIYRKMAKRKIKQNVNFNEPDLNYCRDNLDKLSPGIISYLRDFRNEYKKDISAHVLKLLYEGYLAVDENTIKRSSKDTKELTKTDLEVLKKIDEGNFNDPYNKYEIYIIEEALLNGLIEVKKPSNKKEKLSASLVFWLLFFVTFIVILLLESFINNIFIDIVMFGWIIILFFVFPVYIFTKIFVSVQYGEGTSSYVRTAKGEELIKNIHELEKFLLDFGNLSKKSYKEVYTRDYYLIYAVALGINQIIPREIEEMLNNKKEK